MFICEIQEWMGLIMLEWKVFTVMKILAYSCGKS
jgi:hypothetical protein